MLRLISLLGYYGDLFVNIELVYEYYHETVENKTSGEQIPYTHSVTLSWLMLGFLAFGRIVSFAFFLFNFGFENVPNVSSPHIRHACWSRCTSQIFTIFSLLLFINPLRLDFIARGCIQPDPPVERTRRGKRKLGAQQQEKFDKIWSRELRDEATKVLVFQMAIQAVCSSLPCFTIHLHHMARDGVNQKYAAIVIGAIFSIVNIAFTAVRAGRFVLSAMTADVSGYDVMQFENIRDLASSLWMGTPVVLALVTHIVSIGMWSSMEDVGIGGMIFFVLVYVEIMIFILPWLMTEGTQFCGCIARFRTRFLVVLQVVTSLMSTIFALVWFEAALSEANFHHGQDLTSNTISTTEVISTSSLTTTEIISTSNLTTTELTSTSSLPNVEVDSTSDFTTSPSTSSTMSLTFTKPLSVTTSTSTSTSTAASTMITIANTSTMITTPLPHHHTFTLVRSAGSVRIIWILMLVMQSLTFIFYFQVVVRPSLWLTFCKKIGTLVFKPPIERSEKF